MQQLSGLDSLFLNLETRSCPMHVGSVAILDPSTALGGFGLSTIRAHIESRLHLAPPFRRRLLRVPLDLGPPFWVEAPDFNLDDHILEHHLNPADEGALKALVEDLAEQRLDRRKPLWECHYVEGLPEGRVAVITKIHHACIDGMAGAEILTKLLDTDPEPAAVPPPQTRWRPDKLPGLIERARMAAQELGERPGHALTALRHSLPIVTETGRRLLPGRDHAAAALPHLSAPRTHLNETISGQRSYAYRTLALDDVKAIKSVLGVSVNDVILGLCAEALHQYMAAKGTLPDEPLIAGIPVSVRTATQSGTGGNRVTMAVAGLHTDIVDPIERIHRISAHMNQVKKKTKAMPANLLQDWAEVPSPALMARAAQLLEIFEAHRLVQLPFNLVISNVPGPQQPLYYAGARLLSTYPVSIPYHGLGFNITVLSYLGNLDFGLTAHWGTVPDTDFFADLLQGALSDIYDFAGARKAG